MVRATQQAPRKVLAASLKPVLPKGWQIVPSSRNIDKLQTTVVRLSQQRITRHPQAPAGAHLIEFVATVIPPQELSQTAEDQLDDDVNAFIHALDELGVLWTEAEKVTVSTTVDRLGWDIRLAVATSTIS